MSIFVQSQAAGDYFVNADHHQYALWILIYI